MGKGRVWEDPIFEYEDAYSGREIVRLTDYLGHSNHFYFTDPCWFNDGRSFVFTSQRENEGNLFRYDLPERKITQMTDLKSKGRPGGCVCAVNDAVYFFHNRHLVELKLGTLKERVVCEIDGKMAPRGRANPTADGKHACTLLSEDRPREGKKTISFAYSNFVEQFEARPLNQIAKIDLSTGKWDVVHEERCHRGHVNTSPTLPDILTFCHEGPWNRVDQRIWGLDIQTGKAWKIREQHNDYSIGHEYWFEDGEHLGYHGRPRDSSGKHIFGYIKYDNTDHKEVAFPYHSTHFHSLDEKMMVGDGNAAFAHNSKPYIQLFKRVGDEYVGPKILAYHRSTFNDQYSHCHPRFTPDGKYVLYTSDLTSYSNMYLVPVGDFDELPDLTEDVVPLHRRGREGAR